MYKVFIEYKILEEFCEHYMYSMKIQTEKHGITWMEGTDQPLLFVELWDNVSLEEFETMKKERKAPSHPEWGKLEGWVKGGLSKLHIWHFKVL